MKDVVDYLNSLKWDGVKRSEFLWSRYFGADARSEFLETAVRRVRAPGCEIGPLAVLVGSQGIGKSSGLRALFGDQWFGEEAPDLQDHGGFTSLAGRWCIEWPGLDGQALNDCSRAKAFVAARYDRIREPFARDFTMVPRRCVFVGTSNRSRNQKGSRRFQLVRCGTVAVADIARDRAQLWAEAMATP